MCLILLAHRVHPDYPLIFAANRDEFYDRPTAPAHWWEDAPDVLAGRDLRAGGTWMGVSRDGRWAAVTNYRDVPREGEEAPRARSRGELVGEFLRDRRTIPEYLRDVEARADDYAGFNLLVGTLDALAYISNRGGGVRDLGPGVYGLSNHLLDSPWPKVERGKRGLRDHIARQEPISPEALFEILYDAEPAPDHALPNTGVGIELERALSAPFVASPIYGTRSSTVLLIDRDGAARFIERTFSPADRTWSDVHYEFQVQA